ncbi:MAG: adenylyltransferase/cytidyltransferase family protein, partial [Azospirillum sp.]|nr:adenylyltransferase/cytidyltransferase family protein [Azospirillum sp.]
MTTQGIIDKIKPIAELGEIAERLRAQGKRVVLCHGTFDLLHIGHIRHLQQARLEGDVLFVTVTCDAHVRRGPGRPVFPEDLRAEMLAATQFVDWVGISRDATAETPINAIKPTAYVKGSDYKDPADDITGKIVDEQRAVEAHGGRLIFTEDIVFSSSALLNRHGNIHDPEVQSYLDLMRQRGAMSAIEALLKQASRTRVALIGDAILDEYRYVEPMGKSPKENLIPTRFRSVELFAGGIFAAANHAADFCADVRIATVEGDTDSDAAVIRAALFPNIALTAATRPGAPTTRKIRFVDLSYGRKLFEVVHMDDTAIPRAVERELSEMVAAAVDWADVVVVADFGHGMMTPRIREIVGRAQFLAVNAQTNSANIGFNLITKYKKADYICIDAPEARLATADRDAPLEDIVSRQLPAAIDCPRFV